MSKNLLIIDADSSGLDVAMRAQMHGWQVRYFNNPKRPTKTGKGIVPLISDLDEVRRKWLGWADLIYATGNAKYVDFLEPYRAMGYPIYGANKEATRWEVDRAEGQRVMKEAGLKIIPGKEFHDYDSAISFVQRLGKPCVSKPSGEADKALSYVAQSAADLCYMLGKWAKNDKYRSDAKQHGFILQEKKTGCEMGVGGFFGPHGWSHSWEENFERKKLMPGDIGPNTGEQGTVLRYVRKSKLADAVLKPLTKALHSVGYVGCVDVNCIIDDAGTPWPLELTMRDGWPAKHNQIALQEGDQAQFMLDLVNGVDSLKVKDGAVSVSVVVSIPPYPYSDYADKETEGLPIYGFDIDHVHLCEAMLADDVPVQAGDKVVSMPCYVTAGDYVAVCTGSGETISGAARSAYTAVKKLKVCGSMMYRNDIGVLGDKIERIQKHGFAAGLTA